MAILCLLRVWLIMDHFSMYDMLFVGAASPFMFRVAIFIFALILILLCCDLWFRSVPPGVGGRWWALAAVPLVLGCDALPCVAGLLKGGVLL